eukprot:1188379-Prorocentrum_minimum.AAC.3
MNYLSRHQHRPVRMYPIFQHCPIHTLSSNAKSSLVKPSRDCRLAVSTSRRDLVLCVKDAPKRSPQGKMASVVRPENREKKSKVPESPGNFPLLDSTARLSPDQLLKYERKGYVCTRGLFTEDEINSYRCEGSFIVSGCPEQSLCNGHLAVSSPRVQHTHVTQYDGVIHVNAILVIQ